MSFPRPAFGLAALFLLLFAGVAAADEVSDRQKKVARENLEKSDIRKVNVSESETLIVCAPLPEARLKTVAAALQKTYKAARKGLQFDAKEEPWKGKLTVYVLPERRDFIEFMRTVAGQKPEGTSHVSVRGDEPFAVTGADLGERATDADVTAELAPLVAGALLAAKVGPSATVPTWVRSGFGRAAALRAEGTGGRRFSAYKTQARAAVLGGGGRPPAPVADVWGGERPDAGALATSLMDYMAFGPGSANFPKFLSGLRPDENGNEPSIAMAVEGAGWKVPELEAAWRKWVQGGMVVK
jgi:hypothetical protein